MPLLSELTDEELLAVACACSLPASTVRREVRRRWPDPEDRPIVDTCEIPDHCFPEHPGPLAGYLGACGIAV